jgi:hypothetical protein
MSAQVIDGKAVAAQVRARVAEGVAEFVGEGSTAPPRRSRCWSWSTS